MGDTKGLVLPGLGGFGFHVLMSVLWKQVGKNYLLVLKSHPNGQLTGQPSLNWEVSENVTKYARHGC